VDRERYHATSIDHFGSGPIDRAFAFADDRFHHHAGSDSTHPDDLIASLQASELRLSAFLEDRARLARDLHDIVLQSLYAIGLGIETDRRTGPDEGHESDRPPAPAVGQLNGLIHQVRNMIHRLETGTVEEIDLPMELADLTATYMRVRPMQIEMQIDEDLSNHLTGEEKREITSIAREALSNCTRHAQATQAAVVLRRKGLRVHLLICDNGVGFDPMKQRPGGYGITNMAARARKLGGRFQIQSHIGGGTRIDIEFGLEPILAHL